LADAILYKQKQMKSTVETFNALHQAGPLFILPNAWDAKSASLFEEQGFSAVGTSSAAVAEALGYADGENMPLADYLFVIKRIAASITVPLTVDLEMGYADTKEKMLDNCRQLVGLGAAGINIEDSVISNGKRSPGDAKQFAATIQYIRSGLDAEGLSLFINLRCDTYLLNVGNKATETITRLKIYEQTGADGIFLPCITNEDDIAAAVAATRMPLNVMCMPGLPGFDRLQQLGVKRASMGPFLFKKIYANAADKLQQLQTDKNFLPII